MASSSQRRAFALSSSTSIRLPAMSEAPVVASRRAATDRLPPRERRGASARRRLRRGHRREADGPRRVRPSWTMATTGNPAQRIRAPTRARRTGSTVFATSSASPSSRTVLASATTGRSPAAAQPGADGLAALGGPQADREQLGSVRRLESGQEGQLLVGEVGVEEQQRPGAGPDDRDLLLDGGERIGFHVLRDPTYAEGDGRSRPAGSSPSPWLVVTTATTRPPETKATRWSGMGSRRPTPDA